MGKRHFSKYMKKCIKKEPPIRFKAITNKQKIGL